jgi:hypothetical protein
MPLERLLRRPATAAATLRSDESTLSRPLPPVVSRYVVGVRLRSQFQQTAFANHRPELSF